ncbi:MAG: phosphatase PAP2 family protein [Alphaproteobacteria bacterium]
MISQFPPYGVFADHYAETVEPNNLAPFRWLGSPLDREETYSVWKAKVLGDISHTLWPLWFREKSAWIDPNHDHMLALTHADFDLMSKLTEQDQLEQKPAVSSPSEKLKTHLDYFQDEDENDFGGDFLAYCSEFDETDERHIRKTNQFIRSYYGSISIQFKNEIQRPRAYQTSLMLGKSFNMKLAKSAVTSSMSSGHCFQGCMFGCLVYERWLNANKLPSSAELNALKQFTVDIGDRRVFAGVHYPSDNLSSWLMTLMLIPKVFENPLIGDFMVSAIAERSLVWQCIKESNDPAFTPAVKLIEKTMLETVQSNLSWTPFSKHA